MLLREHAGALRADLRRYYQIDLLDLYRGVLGPREVADYAAHLPPGAAVWRAMGGPAAWSDETAAVANAYNALRDIAVGLGVYGAGAPDPMTPPPTRAELAAAEQYERRHLAHAQRRADRFLARRGVPSTD